jgi:hypothetical protein
MATLMPLVGAGVDESLAVSMISPIIPPSRREALLLKLLDQAAHATVNLPPGLHRVGTLLQGG